MRILIVSGSFGSEVLILILTSGNNDDGQIERLMKNNPDHTTRDIAEVLHMSIQMPCKAHVRYTSLANHLKTIIYRNRYYVWAFNRNI